MDDEALALRNLYEYATGETNNSVYSDTKCPKTWDYFPKIAETRSLFLI